ncbi:MAG: hypothetical protein ACOYPR_09685, partial [Saprospiraceae bacterium]
KTFIDGDTMLIKGLNLQDESTYLVLDGDSENSILLSTSDPEKLVSGNQISLKLQGIEAGVHAIQVYHSLKIGKPATEHKGFSSNTFSFILAPEIINYSLIGNILSITVKPDIPAKRGYSIILNRIVTAAGDTGIREFKLDETNNSPVPKSSVDIDINSLNLPIGDYLIRFKINNAISVFSDDYQSPKISIV